MRKIEKERLLETHKTMNQHITIINAPLEYGKTTAIKQYLKEYNEYFYLWINLKNGKTIIDFLDMNKDMDFLIIDYIKEEHFQINVIKELLDTEHTYHIMMSSDKLTKRRFSDEIQWITSELLSFSSYGEIRQSVDINKIVINDVDANKILEYCGDG